MIYVAVWRTTELPDLCRPFFIRIHTRMQNSDDQAGMLWLVKILLAIETTNKKRISVDIISIQQIQHSVQKRSELVVS